MANDLDHWKFYVQVLAFAGAFAALIFTWLTHAQRSTFDMIDRMYSLCHTLEAHAMREWRVGHLFAISESEYATVRDRIAAHTDPSEYDELLIKEMLFAIHILVVYEQVFYQWQHTSRRLHPRRYAFLSEMVSYFTDRFLRNRRMVFLLNQDPDGATLHLEKKSRRHLNAMLRTVGDGGDALGPFAQRTGRV